MLKKVLRAACHSASLPFPFPFSSHQLCSRYSRLRRAFLSMLILLPSRLICIRWKGDYHQHAPISLEQSPIPALPVLSGHTEAAPTVFLRIKRGEKTKLQLQEMVLTCSLWLERTARLLWLWALLDSSCAWVSTLQLISRRAACRAVQVCRKAGCALK